MPKETLKSFTRTIKSLTEDFYHDKLYSIKHCSPNGDQNDPNSMQSSNEWLSEYIDFLEKNLNPEDN